MVETNVDGRELSPSPTAPRRIRYGYALGLKAAAIFVFLLSVMTCIIGGSGCVLLLIEEQRASDLYIGRQLLQFLYRYPQIVIFITLLAVAAAIVTFLFLMCAAGRRRDETEPRCNFMDRIPFDLYTVLMLAALMAQYWIFTEGIYAYGYIPAVEALLIGLILLCAAAIGLAFCMSFAARVKTKTLFSNTILSYTLRFIGRMMKKVRGQLRYLYRCLPTAWKVLPLFGCYLLIELVLVVAMAYAGEILIVWLLIHFGMAGLLCVCLYQMSQLSKGAERFMNGRLDEKINMDNMLWSFRRHAETLNNISAGLSRAVEEQLKSERMKTELITNVSHDIKTPLTSIINYVDLLKKEELANETANAYIEVIDRQSARLKKLIEDLVEASKATTGNIEVHVEATNITELLDQAVGEYAERFAAIGLEPILDIADRAIIVQADGRLMWRVFDNLLGNVCKYSQPNTRVYLTVSDVYNQISVTIKNISREPLNVSPDELMERFVRGDSSRTTEGSGLGLSIARSLVELQNGTFSLYVDGDLFKVVIGFGRQ